MSWLNLMTDDGRRTPPFPVVIPRPTFSQITSNYNASDYSQWGLITAISFPGGYVLGKGVRIPSMWFTGLVGSFGGFLLAYQNSSCRLMGFGPNKAEIEKYSIPKPSDEQ